MSNYGPPQGGQWGMPEGGYGAPYGVPPQPPIKKRSNTPIILGIVGVAVLIIVLCTGGFFAISAFTGDEKPQASGSRSATATPSDDASSPSASSSSEANPDASTVRPSGAPFEFTVPVGFKEIPPPEEKNSVGAQPKFRAAVGVNAADEKDFLIVTAYDLNADTDNLSDTVLTNTFDDLVRKAGQDPSTRESVMVNGQRALKYRFDYGSSKALSYFVFKGTTEVQVRCQWLEREADINRGCSELVQTLNID